MIKICGITNLEDARKSIEYGATALGFNFYPPSPRYILPSAAESIIRQLPDACLTVGVFVGRPDPGESGIVDVLQLHGLVDESEIGDLDRRVLAAIRPEEADRFPHHDILIDVSWGTGRRADWKELLTLGRSFILSGGLNPENVGEAIRMLNPAGVDVCSGVESEPGRKDWVKLRSFLEAVRKTLASGSEASHGTGRFLMEKGSRKTWI